MTEITLRPNRSDSAGLASAVFLDREGALIKDVGHLSRSDQIRVLPGAFEALKRLIEDLLHVVIVTNQSGMGRGLLNELDLEGIHHELMETFRAEGSPLDAIYDCPHRPEAATAAYAGICEWRKPGAGMLLAAARELRLDLSRNYMTGDSLRDIEAGHRTGCLSVLVHTGEGEASCHRLNRLEQPDFQARDILGGVPWILEKDFEQSA